MTVYRYMGYADFDHPSTDLTIHMTGFPAGVPLTIDDLTFTLTTSWFEKGVVAYLRDTTTALGQLVVASHPGETLFTLPKFVNKINMTPDADGGLTLTFSSPAGETYVSGNIWFYVSATGP